MICVWVNRDAASSAGLSLKFGPSWRVRLIEKVLAERRRFEPEHGFNLVGLDEFEREFGEKLYLIGTYPTRRAAQVALEARRRQDRDEVMFIYGPVAKGRTRARTGHSARTR